MNALIKILTKSGLLREDLDYHLIRASMVIVFLFFGYQKWFDYEAQVLISYISNGPLIFWLYPAFGYRSARRLALPAEAGRGSPDATIRWHFADGDGAFETAERVRRSTPVVKLFVPGGLRSASEQKADEDQAIGYFR